MDGWVEGWMDGWLARWIDGFLDGWDFGGVFVIRKSCNWVAVGVWCVGDLCVDVFMF